MPDDPPPELIWRHFDPDGIVGIEVVRVPQPPGLEVQALPRPAPPQPEPQSWWHWWPWG